MAENFLRLADEILKTQYIDAMRNGVNTEPSFICSKIAENNKGYDGTEWIEGTASIGISGGTGFGDLSGYNTPQAANIMRKKFRESPREYFVAINLLDRLIRSGKSGGALVDYLQDEIEGAYEAAKWNIGRALYGNGKGILAVIGGKETEKVIAVEDAKWLIEGILIDIYPSGAAVGSTPTAAKVRIEAIEGRRSAAPKIYLDRDVSVTAGSFITLQNSYGNEITGIGTVFDDTIPTIGGVSKTQYPWVKPIVKDAEHDITATLIRQALRESDDRNGQIDAIAMGAGAYDAFTEYTQATNIRLEGGNNDIVSGFNTVKFRYGNRLIDIYEEKFIEDGDIIGITTKDIEPHMDELNYAQAAPEAPAFVLLTGTSIYQALLASYGNYIYRNPGAMFKIVHADAAQSNG